MFIYLTLNTRFVILIIIIQCLFGNRQYLYLNINTWAVMTSLLSACLVFGKSSIWISIIPAETLFSEPGNNMNSYSLRHMTVPLDKNSNNHLFGKTFTSSNSEKWMLGSRFYILVWQKQKCFLSNTVLDMSLQKDLLLI